MNELSQKNPPPPPDIGGLTVKSIGGSNVTFFVLLAGLCFVVLMSLPKFSVDVAKSQRDKSECLQRGFDETRYLPKIGEVWCVGLRNGNTITERLR